MEKEIVVQLIETGGLFLLALLGLIFYWKAVKTRKNLMREKALLKDCYFFREVIEKYKLEKGKNNRYNTYREQVRKELGYSPSSFSEPAEIRVRLAHLKSRNERIEAFLDKIEL